MVHLIQQSAAVLALFLYKKRAARIGLLRPLYFSLKTNLDQIQK